jgi:MOSC domain-containing protein YiiM
MGKVIKIGISKKKGGKVLSLDSVRAINGKGLLNDRKFQNNNNKMKQITLIEAENISHYNKVSNTNIPQLDFRRNLVTENIKLNELLNKEFFIGKVKVKGHDLCRPCKYLQNLLKQENFVKELMLKGGLRCEILSDGDININDKISL